MIELWRHLSTVASREIHFSYLFLVTCDLYFPTCELLFATFFGWNTLVLLTLEGAKLKQTYENEDMAHHFIFESLTNTFFFSNVDLKNKYLTVPYTGLLHRQNCKVKTHNTSSYSLSLPLCKPWLQLRIRCRCHLVFLIDLKEVASSKSQVLMNPPVLWPSKKAILHVVNYTLQVSLS